MAVGYRAAGPADRAFIVSAWSSSYRTAHSAGLITMEDWADVMHGQIGKVLDRPYVDIKVAHEIDDPDPIADLYGFIVADVTMEATLYRHPTRYPYVYYVYVKSPMRRMGIARGLFAAMGIDANEPFSYACKTGILSVLAPKLADATFDPLVARYRRDDV